MCHKAVLVAVPEDGLSHIGLLLRGGAAKVIKRDVEPVVHLLVDRCLATAAKQNTKENKQETNHRHKQMAHEKTCKEKERKGARKAHQKKRNQNEGGGGKEMKKRS